MKLNKKQFGELWSKIINTTPINKIIINEMRERIIKILLNSDKFKNIIIKHPNCELKIKNVKMGIRKVRMLVLNYGERDIPVSKAMLVNSLYPRKRKKPLNKKSEVLRVFREAINFQIMEFRRTLKFPLNCELTFKKLNSWDKYDIDHIYPISLMLDEFLELEKVSYDEINLKGRGANKYCENKNLMQKWIEYHKLNAKLRCVDSSANRSKGANTNT